MLSIIPTNFPRGQNHLDASLSEQNIRSTPGEQIQYFGMVGRFHGDDPIFEIFDPIWSLFMPHHDLIDPLFRFVYQSSELNSCIYHI